jgi:nitrate reductase alpha subunit
MAKWLFTYGPGQLTHAKIIEQRPKKDMKRSKRTQNPLKCLNFLTRHITIQISYNVLSPFIININIV